MIDVEQYALTLRGPCPHCGGEGSVKTWMQTEYEANMRELDERCGGLTEAQLATAGRMFWEQNEEADEVETCPQCKGEGNGEMDVKVSWLIDLVRDSL